jgi:hypothetical protein
VGTSPAAPDSRLRISRVRSLDNPVASIFFASKRIPGLARIRRDVPGSAIRNRYDSIVAWSAVSIASAAGGAALTIITGAHI